MSMQSVQFPLSFSNKTLCFRVDVFKWLPLLIAKLKESFVEMFSL